MSKAHLDPSKTSKVKHFAKIINSSETYSKPSQTSEMKLFAKIVNNSRGVFRSQSRTFKVELLVKKVYGWKPSTSFLKSSILDVLLGSKYTSRLKAVDYFCQKLASYIFDRILNMPLPVLSLAILNEWN